jgi:hypothetical protein
MVTDNHDEVNLKGAKHWFQKPWFQWFLAYCDPASAVIDLAHINYLQLYIKTIYFDHGYT